MEVTIPGSKCQWIAAQPDGRRFRGLGCILQSFPTHQGWGCIKRWFRCLVGKTSWEVTPVEEAVILMFGGLLSRGMSHWCALLIDALANFSICNFNVVSKY